MNSHLTQALAHSREQDFLEAAAPSHLITTRSADPIVIRPATADDQPVLDRLAELDSSERFQGAAALVGEVASGPVAALSLTDGRVIADPFAASAQIVELLLFRARQLDTARGLARVLRWRRA